MVSTTVGHSDNEKGGLTYFNRQEWNQITKNGLLCCRSLLTNGVGLVQHSVALQALFPSAWSIVHASNHAHKAGIVVDGDTSVVL